MYKHKNVYKIQYLLMQINWKYVMTAVENMGTEP